MSRPMATYDPDWEARWQKAYDAAMKLQNARALDSADLARQMKLSKELIAELYQAHDAQFKTVADIAASRYESVERLMSLAGKDVPWPVFREDATGEDVNFAYCKTMRMLDRLNAFDLSKKPADWKDGVFREQLPTGVQREIRDREFMFERDIKVKARLIIERHGDAVHCCAIDFANARMSVMSRFEEIATEIRMELLARGPTDWLSTLRRYVRPLKITFYAYAPQMLCDLPADHVFRVKFELYKGKYRSQKWHGAGSVPPLLRRVAMDMDPEFRDLVSVQPVVTDRTASGSLS